MKCDASSLEERFFGSATVGERGQVVIPADARKKLGIQPGDKLLVLMDPAEVGLHFVKLDSLRGKFADFITMLEQFETVAAEHLAEKAE
jgi:AbrB family looped-hinge helix DNA binding protein